ncbi:flagellar export protein FliJ [Desulfovibrio subterraneus]|jgi:flagellar FliJ protein|uniref:flagellar export protein FliJ n=1 Tax=Desulfovibrio subterraneus TaxID=2718620 RepID=UPI0022B8FF9E|nr:flagellar export protein FliJ [Desulfovibrio subterraneus]WBF68754.1 flagellar export protein FliJ [Desulfovibrio subterraneus]
MAPYKFKLQQVLDYRNQLEDQAKMAFTQAQQRYDAHVARVNGLRQRLAEYEPKLYQTNNPSELWLLRNFVQALTLDVATAESRLLQLAQELNKARQNLVKKSQERKLLDKLKENQAKRHAKEERFKEQQQFDETATLRYKPQTV